MKYNPIREPISIDQPMVIIPAEEYRFLLREAGYSPTPKLDKGITSARRRFKNGKTISWKSFS